MSLCTAITSGGPCLLPVPCRFHDSDGKEFQTPPRTDPSGHRPQDTPSVSRAGGSAPGLATTGAPDLLRKAAYLMRINADSATTGDGESLSPRWVTDAPGTVHVGRYEVWAEDEGSVIASGLHMWTARHVASWNPAVALAVADLLDHAAARAESKIAHGGGTAAVWSHERDALAVARAYLGEQS